MREGRGQPKASGRRLRRAVAAAPAVTALAAALGFLKLPVVSFDAPVSTILRDRDGQLIAGSIAKDEQWRFPARTEPVPERFATALIAFEDRRFLRHPGVDPVAIVRAAIENGRAGHVVSGASTLTMQVVRMSRSNPARTYSEKVLEMALALRLDGAKSKPDILRMYSDNAPFGGNVVGLDAAAWRYFGRAPEELSWAEAVTLAVLPNSPALIHPGRNRDQLQNKRDRLLEVLHEEGVLDDTDLLLARAEPLPEAPHPLPHLAPHLLGKALSEGTHHVDTTIDASLQRRATEVILRHHQHLATNGVHNAAALIVEIDSGRVAAYVGNVPHFSTPEHQNHVDVVTSSRSTGSTLKPFLYAAMIDEGEVLPRQLIPDVPTRIAGFSPENFDRAYDGAVPASQALARSRNVPAVWMLREHGVNRFYGELQQMGMSTLHRTADNYGLALILGGAEGTLWDLTSMYRDLAFSAKYPGESSLHSHWQGAPSKRQPSAISPGASWLTLEALLEVNRPGVHGAWRSFESNRKIAWKTGTSYGFRDAWAIGVSPKYAIGVWIGNADGEGRPNLTGFQAAAPVLFDLFDLVDGGSWFEAPEDELVEVRVCSHSGMRAGPDCSHSELQQLPRAAAETGSPCAYCERIHCDPNCRAQVHAGCSTDIRSEPWFVLPPTMAWFYQQRHADYRQAPELREDCRTDSTLESQMSVLYPRHGSEVYVPVELSGDRGRVVFEATHRDRDAEVYWHLDNTFIGTTSGIHHMELAPDPGAHVLTVVDSRGESVQRRFTALPDDRVARATR